MTEIDLDASSPEVSEDPAPQRLRRLTVAVAAASLILGAVVGVGARALVAPAAPTAPVARWDVRQAGPPGTQVEIRADLTVWNTGDHDLELLDLSARRPPGSAAAVSFRPRPSSPFPRRVSAGGSVSVEVDAVVDCATSPSDRAGQRVDLHWRRDAAAGLVGFLRGEDDADVTSLSLRGLLRPTTCPGAARGNGPEQALSDGVIRTGEALDVLLVLPPEALARGPRAVTGFRLGPEYAGGPVWLVLDGTPRAVRLDFVPAWCEGAQTSAPTELELVPANAVAGQRLLVRVGPDLATWWLQQTRRVCPG